MITLMTIFELCENPLQAVILFFSQISQDILLYVAAAASRVLCWNLQSLEKMPILF